MINERYYKFYVDGSYTTKVPNKYGWGYVMYAEDILLHQDSGVGAEFIESRQIGGECEATIKALEFCVRNRVPDIEILYDYEGIKKWVTSEWRAKKRVSIKYKKRIIKLINELKDYNPNVNILFTHVKSHTGNVGNELADKLAKEALEEYKI